MTDPDTMAAWEALTIRILGGEAKIRVVRAANGAVISVHAFVLPHAVIHARHESRSSRAVCGAFIHASDPRPHVAVKGDALFRTPDPAVNCRSCLASYRARARAREAREKR